MNFARYKNIDRAVNGENCTINSLLVATVSVVKTLQTLSLSSARDRSMTKPFSGETRTHAAHTHTHKKTINECEVASLRFNIKCVFFS